MLKIAIDRGGTFTDIYASYQGKIYTKKILSESSFYEDANTQAIKVVLEEIFQKEIKELDLNIIKEIRLGTTVATNALLEEKGAKVALAVTKGFKDLLNIGYQNRSDLFALKIKKPKPLFNRVIEIDERLLPQQGEVIEIEPLKDCIIQANGKEALAIVLLHSYKNSSHEKEIAKRAKGFEYVAISSEVAPSLGAINRAYTTVIDAYLTPILQEYSQKIVKNLKDGMEKIFFIKSDGGLCKIDEFRGANAILSGPAGGVVALSSIYNGKPLIGFDMGGTSTDVSRYDGKIELAYEKELASSTIVAPMVDIYTVAAGGGSRLFYKNEMFVVGPESSGSNPGPLCYGKDGYLSVTDANLVLNRLDIESIPAIFGKSGKEPLNKELSRKGFEPIAKKLNASIEAVAEAFLDVANEQMANAIKEITIKKGFDVKEHILCAFGGAGGQHAVGVARKLGIREIFIHKNSGILSAVGIANANITKSFFKVIELPLAKLNEQDWSDLPQGNRSYFIKYKGTNTSFEVKECDNIKAAFEKEFVRVFGFLQDEELIVERIKVEQVIKGSNIVREKIEQKEFAPIKLCKIYIDGAWHEAKVYKELGAFQEVLGPALILQESSTIVLDSKSKAVVNEYGDITIYLEENKKQEMLEAAKVALYSNRMHFIASKMGDILTKVAISANIKERKDYSCAIFDKDGNLVTNAPHIPVHLGSMSSVIKAIIKKFPKIEDASYISNVPYEGGSHLPDITVATPCIKDGRVLFWVASRGHHADIGGVVPGSMPPFSKYLKEEGAIIEAFKVVDKGVFQEEKLRKIFAKANAKDIKSNISDIKAQIAANMEGIKGVLELKDFEWFFEKIQEISQKKVAKFFENLEVKQAEDFLDNGAKIALKVYKKNKKVVFDFSSSSLQLLSNQNTPTSVVRSCVLYAIRVMLNEDIPLNEGLIKDIEIITPKGSLLNPSKELAVVGGNVTTSQRVVDVIFKAFEVAAASSGCMNNVIFGDETFGYYETIAGGSGAGKGYDGVSAVHTHMTNTKITDVEVLESRYPIKLNRFEIRKNSGGEGKFKGGDGVIREYEFLKDLEVSILTERRVFAPYGMAGGEDGAKGENLYISNEQKYNLTSKAQLKVKKGDRIVIKTPGGGGYGKKK